MSLKIAKAVLAAGMPRQIGLFSGRPPIQRMGLDPGNVLLVMVQMGEPQPLSHGCVTRQAGVAVIRETGMVEWARLFDRYGGFICDADVSLTGEGGALEFDTMALVAGGTVSGVTMAFEFRRFPWEREIA